jgi:hypothetical protein
MSLQTQTTIRILIVAAAGVATLALARPVPSSRLGATEIPLMIPNVDAGSGTGSITHLHEPAAGFAVFCEDRH